MRYLKRTKDYVLTYRRSYQLEITGYFNSDFLDAKIVKDSLLDIPTCWMMVQFLGAIPRKLSLSTMTTEFIACFEASNHGIWLRNLVTRMHIMEGIERPHKLYCDNKPVVIYSNNNMSSTKSKHIDIKLLVVK